GPHVLRVVEVDLAAEPDDDRPVVVLDAGDRRSAQSVSRLPHTTSLTLQRRCGNRVEVIDAENVAARASTENFPVASLLFPREHRPHLRAIYGFARLVDILGDEAEGDRLALLDELERELDACYGGEPTWPVMRQLQPTILACDLPREPFRRLIDC